MAFRRVIRNFTLIRNARRFRIPFLRKALFRVPQTISINGTMCDLQFPDELGIRNDFLGCFIEDAYGLREFNFTPRTILDIGANVGFFSMAARSYYPQAMIHAYEPNPRIIEALANQARAAAFQYFSEAIGPESGTVEIAENGDSNQARTRVSESGSIKQVSLQEAIHRMGGFVDVAKIDCEGAEWQLFEASECWRSISHVRMEYHLPGQRTFSDVIENMERLGFKTIRHVPSGGFGLIWAVKNH